MKTREKSRSLRGQSMLLLAGTVLLLIVAAIQTVKLSLDYAAIEQREQDRRYYYDIVDRFRTKMDKVEALMTSLSYLDSMQRALIDKRLYGFTAGWDNFLYVLFSYSTMEDGIENIAVVDLEGTPYLYQYYHEVELYNEAIESATEHLGYSGIYRISGKNMFTISRPVYRYRQDPDSGTQRTLRIGTCIFFLNMDALAREIGLQESDAPERYMILGQDNQPLYGADALGGQALQYLPATYDAEGEYAGRLMADNGSYSVYTNDIPGTGWRLAGFAPVKESMLLISEMSGQLLLTWLVVIVLASALVFLMFNRLYTFIRQITGHMALVERGEWDRKMQISDLKEFNLVADGFDRMMGRIKDLTRQNIEAHQMLYEKEIDRQQLRFNTLQSQINPHFLYNTLECVKSIGVFREVDEVRVIAESLAQMLRYGLKGATMVTVRDEIRCVENYLRIQNIRFLDKYTCQIDVDPLLNDAPMLRMILQPLVENAIIHGMEMRPGPGRLLIHIQRLNERAYTVSVIDDGVGMNGERLAALRAELDVGRTPESAARLGLINVSERLALYYGERGRLEIHSEEGKGTRVLLSIQYAEEE